MTGQPPVPGVTRLFSEFLSGLSMSLLVRYSVAMSERKGRSLFKVILSGTAVSPHRPNQDAACIFLSVSLFF